MNAMNTTVIDVDLLRRLPLPVPEAGNKDDRGRVLVVAGSVEVAGAALLSGTAALRAGAGKLQLATGKSAAILLAMSIPEAMVVGLAETSDGGIDPAVAKRRLAACAVKVDAVLIGPGMTEGEDTLALTVALCAEAAPSVSFVVDAASICNLRQHAQIMRSLEGRVVITPHAGEMAQLLDRSRGEIEADPLRAALDAADLLKAVVVMKGARTFVVTPESEVWLYEGGGVGLATSGSGDVLAGLIAGLVARGAGPARAAIWGVYLHGQAGKSLGEKVGRVGYLARELMAEATTAMRLAEQRTRIMSRQSRRKARH